MKKIISLLLALTCVFALFSCGKSDAEIFIDTVNSSSPTRIITQTSYNDSENTLRGRFETTVDGSNTTLTYSYQSYELPSADKDPDAYIRTSEGTVYYKDGLYSTDGENWGTDVPSASAMQVKLALSIDCLGDYKISDDGKTLTAKITAEQAEKLLGIKLSATEDGISLTIAHDGTHLRSISVSYATANAVLVTLETSYSYNAISVPEVPETPEQPAGEE